MNDVLHAIAHEPKSFEAGALAALEYITDIRRDLDDLCLRVAEKIGADVSAMPDWPRGAVDLLDDLTDLLARVIGPEPPEPGEIDAVLRRALEDRHLRGQ